VNDFRASVHFAHGLLSNSSMVSSERSIVLIHCQQILEVVEQLESALTAESDELSPSVRVNLKLTLVASIAYLSEFNQTFAK